MNSNEQYNNKMSPIYFHTHNTIKKYLEENNVEFKVNNSFNIELFTLWDYKNISENILNILKDVDTITIDTIEFFWNKNITLKLPNGEILNVFCNLSFIKEVKNNILWIIK